MRVSVQDTLGREVVVEVTDGGEDVELSLRPERDGSPALRILDAAQCRLLRQALGDAVAAAKKNAHRRKVKEKAEKSAAANEKREAKKAAKTEKKEAQPEAA
jgi:hypothetical protein